MLSFHLGRGLLLQSWCCLLRILCYWMINSLFSLVGFFNCPVLSEKTDSVTTLYQNELFPDRILKDWVKRLLFYVIFQYLWIIWVNNNVCKLCLNYFSQKQNLRGYNYNPQKYNLLGCMANNDSKPIVCNYQNIEHRNNKHRIQSYPLALKGLE